MPTKYAQQDIDFEHLLLIAGGHSAFQLLWAGIELGLFNFLSASPSATFNELALRLKLKSQPLYILLTGLTALGLLKKVDEGYRNAELVEERLVSGKPGYLGGILGWQAHIVYPGLQNFVESLKQNTNVGLQHFPGQGKTLYERLVSYPEIEKVFQDAMSGLSAQANQHLLNAYDFSHLSHLVDAGGGDATNAIALARHYANLKVTVFDSPSVCEIARHNIIQAGLTERIFTYPGDFLIDPFPPGIDSIIFCHIMPIWSAERNLALLKKAYAALPKGGAVLIFNMMGDDDDTGPLSTALGSPYFLAIATGEGMLHPWRTYETALSEARYAEIKRIDNLPLNHGLLIGIK
jgi:hypothetical protein